MKIRAEVTEYKNVEVEISEVLEQLEKEVLKKLKLPSEGVHLKDGKLYYWEDTSTSHSSSSEELITEKPTQEQIVAATAFIALRSILKK